MNNVTFIKNLYNLSKKQTLTREMLLDILCKEYNKPLTTARAYIGTLIGIGILHRELGCITIHPELINGLKNAR